jgi:uncharacterized membrane protein YtjA (UPF0391 family)
MLIHYTVVFIVIALIAGALGLKMVAGTAASIAKICFVIFIILAVGAFLQGRI